MQSFLPYDSTRYSLFFSCVQYGKNTRLPVDFNMMLKKVSGIEGSDRDDASEVTDVASGNDEVKRMRTKMMVKRLIMKTKMMVKGWVEKEGENAVPPSMLIFQYFY